MKKQWITFVLVAIASALSWGNPADAVTARAAHRFHFDLDLRFGQLDKASGELADWVEQLDEELNPAVEGPTMGDLETDISIQRSDTSELQTKVRDLESVISDLKDMVELQTTQIADLASQVSDLQKKKPR